MPTIGITCTFDDQKKGFALGANYPRAFYLAGGTPVILPTLPPEKAAHYLMGIDGLVLSGGGDVDPLFLGEDPHPAIFGVEPDRDAFETALARLALKMDLPLLGICRGAQVLALAAGGSLEQHLDSRAPGRILHRQSAPRSHPSHRILIQEGTWLYSQARAGELRVNSFHHQAIRDVRPGFQVSARAPDGVIEAVEHPERRFAVGLQWHPEAQAESCGVNMRILQSFVAACS